MDLEFQLIKPASPLADFVDFFWMMANHSAEEKEVVVLPDGRIDIFFAISAIEPYHVMLMGLGVEPKQQKIIAWSKIFAISFNLLAVEYILDSSVADILNRASPMPDAFWDITRNDLDDFENFCRKVSAKMEGLLTNHVDERKQKLFQLI